MTTAEELYDDAEPEEIVVVDEKPEEAPTGVKEEETAEEETPAVEEAPPAPVEKTTVPLSALEEQRSKRQAIEKENAELKAKLEEQTPPTSVFEDESKFVEEISTNLDQKLTNQALNQSQFFVAREIGEDALNQKIDVFKDLVKGNEPLRQQFANAISPYHELVDIVDKHEEVEKMKDVDAYKAKLKAEAKAELKAELEAEEAKKVELRESIPESLVNESSTGGLTSSDWSGPPPAEDLYN